MLTHVTDGFVLSFLVPNGMLAVGPHRAGAVARYKANEYVQKLPTPRIRLRHGAGLVA